MRITKKPDERRQEIIDTAKALFAQNGFMKTTISDIASKIGIAKGLFYYYFKTKDEVMAAVIEQYIDEIQKKVDAIVQATDQDYLTRLSKVISVIINLSKDAEKLFVELKKSDRFMFHQSILEYAVKRLGKTAESMVNEGIAEGVIRCKHPRETLQILFYGFGMVDFSAMDNQQILEIVAQSMNMPPEILSELAL